MNSVRNSHTLVIWKRNEKQNPLWFLPNICNQTSFRVTPQTWKRRYITNCGQSRKPSTGYPSAFFRVRSYCYEKAMAGAENEETRPTAQRPSSIPPPALPVGTLSAPLLTPWTTSMSVRSPTQRIRHLITNHEIQTATELTQRKIPSPGDTTPLFPSNEYNFFYEISCACQLL